MGCTGRTSILTNGWLTVAVWLLLYSLCVLITDNYSAIVSG